MMINNTHLPAEYRPDCGMRLRAILATMGDLKGKSLIDIGCANGFFSHGFLISGGKEAIGIEPDYDWRKAANSFNNKASFEAFELFSELKPRKFDFALYMDIHYHLDKQESDAYLKFLSENVKVSYISCSGDGANNNQRILKDMNEIFAKVEGVIDTPYANRMIFRCESKVSETVLTSSTLGGKSKK